MGLEMLLLDNREALKAVGVIFSLISKYQANKDGYFTTSFRSDDLIKFFDLNSVIKFNNGALIILIPEILLNYLTSSFCNISASTTHGVILECQTAIVNLLNILRVKRGISLASVVTFYVICKIRNFGRFGGDTFLV